jgi:hypothetical protein
VTTGISDHEPWAYDLRLQNAIHGVLGAQMRFEARLSRGQDGGYDTDLKPAIERLREVMQLLEALQ